MSDLRRAVVKLAYDNPSFRSVLLPVLARVAPAPSAAYRPPKGIAAAVHAGTLDPKVLLVWKYIVDKLGDKFSYGAAIAYWRNKCKKEGIVLPKEFITGLGGKGITAGFPIKDGDQIEVWVKETLKNAGLVQEVGKTAAQAELDIHSLERKIAEAKAKVQKHLTGIEEGSRVQQRRAWLAKAQAELRVLEGQLAEASKGVEAVQDAVARHETHQAASITFEQQFRKLLLEAQKELKPQAITTKVLAALADFNAKLETETSVARVAALGDIGKAIARAFDKVKGLIGSITSWAKGLFNSAGRINKLLDKAGAA